MLRNAKYFFKNKVPFYLLFVSLNSIIHTMSEHRSTLRIMITLDGDGNSVSKTNCIDNQAKLDTGV